MNPRHGACDACGHQCDGRTFATTTAGGRPAWAVDILWPREGAGLFCHWCTIRLRALGTLDGAR